MKKPVEFSTIWFLLELFPGQEKAGITKNCCSTVFFAQEAYLIGKFLFLIKSFFVNLFFWTRKTQFWQSCRSFLLKSEFSAIQTPKKLSKTVFQASCFSAKWFLDKKNAVFTTPPEKNAKFEFFSPKLGNDQKVYKFFNKKCFLSNCSSRHRQCTFETTASTFIPEDETFFLAKPKEINKFVHFSEKSFFL